MGYCLSYNADKYYNWKVNEVKWGVVVTLFGHPFVHY